jgi:sulfite reductase alpha subunit-like flavoprotein
MVDLTSDQPLPSHLPTGVTTLRKLLTEHLDMRCSPRKSFFEWLRRISPDDFEQSRLDEFIADPVSTRPILQLI